MSERRAILFVLDGVGIGELPDAADYGDEGSNTLANMAKAVGGLNLPNLQRMGLGNIERIEGVPPAEKPIACYGKMREVSAGKDTTTGHWEIAGVIREKPFPTYPNGFPPEIIEAFEKAIGRKVLGNKPASGTAIIEELGEEHLRTGYPIVYTSADSVFQIAAHEEIVPVEQLYEWCRIAREILRGEHEVARVIARPFIGTPGNFKRTPRRRDFSVPPPYPTLLDALTEAGLKVVTVGKIDDIFAGRGVTFAIHTSDNRDGMQQVETLAVQGDFDFLWCTLVDFDTVYGHRNNPQGFAQALKEFDEWLGNFLPKLMGGDLLIITADHGNDPTTPSTDHSREYVPLLIWTPSLKEGKPLGVRQTFADVAATIADWLKVEWRGAGKSCLNECDL
ncbi:phosphopentomutase [Fervidibacter sacchari]|uniref:Phosphopentomutase n=1 Tax=Candidatus Fervidibacter sacchari TaxID=1448929 RepID=A0ABT2EJB4_9BACT|nr:phosphopentomutase [Candidatus Fervidibacter sacchari]MCS3917925.1 phosphopentomutase [Candidatus Fervidibacter sacchari]WKU15741.1 phosphopentomutase [Candidatus Fervidibacter sacchari]